MKPFDATDAPLAGWNLLEANAGTGKTFSICLLYLRLILERGLEHEQIVAITFTRVATAELKTRIGDMIDTAVRLLRGDAEVDAVPDLVRICRSCSDDPEAAARLARARAAFDLAPIHTIHGFCQRVLTDHAVATGFDPDLKLVENEQLLLEPIAGRAWAELSAGFSDPFSRYLQRKRKARLADLCRTILQIEQRPGARLVGQAEDNFEQREPLLIASLEQCRQEAARTWGQVASEVGEILATHPGLNQGRYGPKHTPAILGAVERALLHGDMDPKDGKLLARLTPSALRKATKKGQTTPGHRFFDAFDEFFQRWSALIELYAEREDALALALWPLVRERYEDWKFRHGIMSYADLVGRLHDALLDPESGPQLVRDLGDRYQAALVDEFQDTDQYQFEIFRRLFADASVWLVGDPKQSLYAFRGADVFAYLEAREQASGRFRLTTDWRAQPPLVDTVNALFAGRSDPFAVPEIRFSPSHAANSGASRVLIDGRPLAAMRCLDLGDEHSPGPMQNLAAQRCADEIALLLEWSDQGRAVLEKNAESSPLTAGQIAVLVRSRAQAGKVASALSEYGIACVQPSVQDVFLSDHAEDIERLMTGVCEYERPDRMAGAAATRLVAADAATLVAIRHDDAVAQLWAERFSQWRQVWQEQGLFAMLIAVLGQRQTAARTLPRIDGRRDLCNWLHVVELTERGCPSASHSCASQVAWLNARRRSTAEQSADSLERLESQGDVVRITTIHAAKGDQFPLTFCPFLWHRWSPSSEQFVEYHQDNQLVLDFSAQRKQWIARRDCERLSEELRMAYVALTRAEASCWIAWSALGNKNSSALDYLLSERPGGSPMEVLAVNGVVAATPAAAPSSACDSRVRRSAASYPMHRKPARQPGPGWKVESYSSLFGGRDLERDVDQRMDPGTEAGDPGYGDGNGAAEDDELFALPAGARTGLMVHELLEKLPAFDLESGQIEVHAQEALDRYGLSDRFARPLADRIATMLSLPLGPERLCLREVPWSDQVREMEFTLRVEDAGLRELWTLVRGSQAPAGVSGKLNGFLRGFIDLVVRRDQRYFIIDYKSNHLGHRSEDYSPQRLTQNVRRHQYDLQYHLYAMALDRLLRQRQRDYDPERHFGGVCYLYLRGLGPSQNGVHFERPASSTLEALHRLVS